MSQRDFNTPQRCDWNLKIHNILKTIDLHTELHLKTNDIFHWQQAEVLRKYIYDLKSWIKVQEVNIK